MFQVNREEYARETELSSFTLCGFAFFTKYWRNKPQLMTGVDLSKLCSPSEKIDAHFQQL